MENSTHIGIFGGAFDPPHMGHLLTATYFLACEPEAQLLFVPSLRHPFDKDMAAFTLRVAWSRTLAKLIGRRAKVSLVEKHIEGSGRTLLVVLALRLRFPRARFSVVVGADAYAQKDKWFSVGELERQASFFVVGRGGVASPQGHLAMPEVSSTDLRARIARGEGCARLMPAAILDRVLQSGAYRG